MTTGDRRPSASTLARAHRESLEYIFRHAPTLDLRASAAAVLIRGLSEPEIEQLARDLEDGRTTGHLAEEEPPDHSNPVRQYVEQNREDVEYVWRHGGNRDIRSFAGGFLLYGTPDPDSEQLAEELRRGLEVLG